VTSIQDRRDEWSTSRVPPHSRESEESVIGAILMSADAANEVMDKLDPEDFYFPAHQSIYRAIRNLFNNNQAIDAITVSEELRRSGELERVGGVPAITRLLDIVPSASNIEYYSNVVEENAQRRALIKAGSTITDLALRLDDEIHTVLDRAEQTVMGVAGRKVGDSMQPIGPLFFTTLEELEVLEQRGSEVTGLSTEFRDLDKKLTGLHPANLVIIAARPAMGKCLVGSTLVVDPKTGARVRLDEFLDEEKRSTAHLLSLDEHSKRFTVATPVSAVDNGVRPVFRVTTRLGRTITATGNHPLLTIDGWRELRDLPAGAAIAVPGRLGVYGVDRLDEETFTDLLDDDSANVGDAVFRLPEDQLVRYLTLALGESWSDVGRCHTIPSETLAHDLQHLLLRFGVVARLVTNTDSSSLVVEAHSSSELLFDPIVRIEPAGEERTYDIEVPIHHNFVADDVVVHNSALTMNIATNVALRGMPVAIFSLEMSKEEVAQRMLCSVARIDSMKVRTGQIGEASWPRLTDAAGKLYNAPVFVDDSPVVTVTDIRAKCRRLKRVHGLQMVVVDYIQLMQGGSKENRQQEIAEISRSLKNLARELEIPILAVSQLNRNLEQREDKRPRLGDLRESGSLEQDADIVMFIYRDEYYNEHSDRKGVAEVIVAKHRAGSTGTVDMTFMPEYTRFSDLGRD
jgi:replicative DNA helicase